MDNSYYQNHQAYIKPNKLLRRMANDTVGRNFGTLLMMLLIILGISMGVSLVMSFIQIILTATGILHIGTSVIDQSSIIRDYGAAVTEPSLDVFARAIQLYEDVDMPPALFFLSALVSLAGSMVLQALYQGYMSGCIRMVRGEKVGASCVFSRMGSILKVLGLNLWVGLLCFLWMLPGLVVCFIGLGLAMAKQLLPVALILLYGGMIGMIVLGVMASYRYAMAPCALADEPKKGVFQAVARSSEITWGRKFQLFRLTVPHVLLMLLFFVVLMLNFASLVLQPVFFAALGLLASIIVLPALMYAAVALYVMCCPMALAAFYGKYTPERLASSAARVNLAPPVVPTTPAAPAAPVAPAEPAAPVMPEAAAPVETPAPVMAETAAPAEPRPMMPAPEAPAAAGEPRPVIPAEPTAPLTPVALEEVLPPMLPVTREIPEAPIDLADIVAPTLPVEPENPAQPE